MSNASHSYTAERWWVRMGARWIARVDAVKSHLNLAFQGMTGVGIASGALKYYGLEQYVGWFLAVSGGLMLAYAYLYSEGGVWNQVSRDRSDMSNNFATPRDKIDDTLIGIAAAAAFHGREPSDDEVDAIEQAVAKKWEDFRDGVDLSDGKQTQREQEEVAD